MFEHVYKVDPSLTVEEFFNLFDHLDSYSFYRDGEGIWMEHGEERVEHEKLTYIEHGTKSHE